jgi:hypothetical protein|tara:strand:- start:199 stop:552 length:354 start_codon:yes stop_codon:yes gene_type:complete
MTRKADTAPQTSGALTQFALPAFGSMFQMGTAWMENVTAISAEMAEFMSTRLQQDMAAQQALFGCKTLGELEALRADFLKTTMSDYMAQASKIAEMTGKVSSEMAVDQLHHQHATPL